MMPPSRADDKEALPNGGESGEEREIVAMTKGKCGHCHDEIPITGEHDCTPECLHCGATYGDLENPEYDSAKIAVSRHQRQCDERPAGWDKPITDPEAEFRAARRRRERVRQWEERMQKRRHVW